MQRETQLCDLSDDCLIDILHILPLRDYWQMGSVCQRFRELTVSHCPSRFKVWSDAADPVTQHPDEVKTNLTWMLRYMSAGLQHLELHALTAEQLKLLEQHELPRVRSLKVRLSGDAEGLDVAAILARACPNAERVLFEGTIANVEGFSMLQSLDQLELYGGDAWGTLDNLTTVFERCRLRLFAIQWLGPSRKLLADFVGGISACRDSLAQVSLSGEFLSAFLPQLGAFPLLRKVAFVDVELLEGEDSCLDRLLAPFAERIVRFGSSFDYIPFNVNDISDLRNLRQWIINDQSVSCTHVERVGTFFGQLREVQCWNKGTYFQRYPSESDEEADDFVDEASELSPLEIVAVFSGLDILAVPIEWLDTRFLLADLLQILRSQPNRKQPLELHCLVEQTHANHAELQLRLRERECPQLLRIQARNYPEGWKWPHWDTVTRHYMEFHLAE